ncbi:MAG TPA: hypothetical protein VF102_13535 [Gemmatimonadaceae bacterium]
MKLKDDKVIVLRGGEVASWIEESGVFCFASSPPLRQRASRRRRTITFVILRFHFCDPLKQFSREDPPPLLHDSPEMSAFRQ